MMARNRSSAAAPVDEGLRDLEELTAEVAREAEDPILSPAARIPKMDRDKLETASGEPPDGEEAQPSLTLEIIRNDPEMVRKRLHQFGTRSILRLCL